MNRLEHCLFHGLPAVRICANNGATATVTLHGAHVVSWTSPGGVEQLYFSPNTRFEPGQAIRGGVPVVFPQFNTRGVLPRHGFARTSPWNLLETQPLDNQASATLSLPGNKVIKSLWPYTFGCELHIALQDDSLAMTLTVRNDGSETFSFQAALHTYLAVGSIQSVNLTGLDGSDFEDTTEAQPMVMKRHVALKPLEAIDRIYYDAPNQLQLQSASGRMDLQQSGFCDVVVWNPGSKAAPPPDLPADGYQHFLCVEAAQIGRPVALAAAQVWTGTQRIRAAH
jgi:glucose-6-phosphate 1-epimerase